MTASQFQSLIGSATPGSTPQTFSAIVNGESVEETIMPMAQEPINTDLPASMSNGPYTCNYDTMYGYFLGTAFAKIRLDSGYCNTTPSFYWGAPPGDHDSLSDIVVTAEESNGTLTNGTGWIAANAFGSYYQSSAVNDNIVGETYNVCMEDTPGHIYGGLACKEVSNSPY